MKKKAESPTEQDKRESDRRAAVNAADETGLVREQELIVEAEMRSELPPAGRTRPVERS